MTNPVFERLVQVARNKRTESPFPLVHATRASGVLGLLSVGIQNTATAREDSGNSCRIQIVVCKW